MTGPPEPYNPYAPPLHEPGALGTGAHARVLGPLLILGNGSTLPPLCIKCGTSGGAGHLTGELASRDERFLYAPAWARLLGPIVRLFVQKRSRFVLPICARCNATWRRWNAIAVLGVLSPLGMLAVSATMVASPRGTDPSSTAFMLAIPVCMLGLSAVFRLRARHVVLATRIDRDETWLRGVHADAMRAAVEAAGEATQPRWHEDAR